MAQVAQEYIRIYNASEKRERYVLKKWWKTNKRKYEQRGWYEDDVELVKEDVLQKVYIPKKETEVKNPAEVPAFPPTEQKSTDVTGKEAVLALNKLETAEAIEEYTEGDERAAVVSAKKKKLQTLK